MLPKFILIALFLTVSLFSQTFRFTTDEVYKTGNTGDEIVFEFHITNISESPQSIYILRTINITPENWQSSLCFDEACFAPFVDSIVTNGDFGSSTLQPGEHRDFSVHFFTDNSIDSASAQILAVSIQDPLDIKVVNLFATTDISGDIKETIPSNFTLLQNYPNPFNPETNIKFSLYQGSDISLKVFDSQGKFVRDIASGYFNAGEYEFKFDASNFASGIYYYEFKSNNFKQSKKMVILK